jgi:hypothetical protein
MLNDRVADHPLLLSLDEARSGYSVKLVQLEGAVIMEGAAMQIDRDSIELEWGSAALEYLS